MLIKMAESVESESESREGNFLGSIWDLTSHLDMRSKSDVDEVVLMKFYTFLTVKHL